MKQVMRVAAVAFFAMAICGLAGCGTKAPDAVALEVMEALQAGKATPEFLSKYCTPESATMLAMFGQHAKESLKGAKFTVMDTNINGDKAVVSIKKEGGESPRTEKIDLVRVDGAWKLNLKKEVKSGQSKPSEE